MSNRYLCQNFTRSLTATLFVSFLLAAPPAHAGKAEVKSERTNKPIYELPRKNLYGVGVAEDNASVSIINGNVYVARLSPKGTVALDDSIKTITSSMIYSNVALWTEVPLKKETATQGDLHNLINKTLREFGYENPGTVPFLLKGTLASAKFHVGSKVFSEKNAEAIVVGYFTKTVPPEGEPTFKSTMNIVLQKKKQAGQLEEFSLSDKTSLFLPR